MSGELKKRYRLTICSFSRTNSKIEDIKRFAEEREPMSSSESSLEVAERWNDLCPEPQPSRGRDGCQETELKLSATENECEFDQSDHDGD